MNVALEAGKQTLDLAAELGVAGVPLKAKALLAEGVENAMAPLRGRGLSPCQIDAIGWNPLHPDPAVVEADFRNLEAALPLAAQTGCRWVVIGPGNHHPSLFLQGDPRNGGGEALDRFARALEPLLALAEPLGLCLCVEPYLKGVVRDGDSFLELHRRVPSAALRCNLDVASCYDYSRAMNPGPFVARMCAQLAAHLGVVHIKEIAAQEGFHLHMGLCPVGRGNTDWTDLVRRILPALEADSWILIEHQTGREEAASALDLIRRGEAALR